MGNPGCVIVDFHLTWTIILCIKNEPATGRKALRMLHIAAEGFREAFGRHQALRTTSDPARLFVPTAECAYWAAVLDEQLWSWTEYEEVRAQSKGGLLMPGLRYIRNLKTHGLPMTLQKVDGAMFPIVFPAVFSEVVWLPFEALPEPNQINRRTEAQRDSYCEFMAGKPTRHTFHHVDEFFTQLAGLDNSPLAN